MTKAQRVTIARALCRHDGHAENAPKDGRPMWENYLPAADAVVASLAGAATKKSCPECGHVFKGKGWDGIDAHWKSKHEHIMPYAEAWPLIQSGRFVGQA